jgi:hypothetical protein
MTVGARWKLGPDETWGRLGLLYGRLLRVVVGEI